MAEHEPSIGKSVVNSQPIKGANRLKPLKKGSGIYFTNERLERPLEGRIIEASEDGIACHMRMTDALYKDSPSKGTPFTCAVPAQSCTYRFRTAFVASAMLPDKKWLMKAPETVCREQSRHFVRIPAQMDMVVRFKNAYGGSAKAEDVLLVDISVSGICFTHDEPVDDGSLCEVIIYDLPGYGEFRTTAKVCRCVEKKVLAHVVYHVGCMFTDTLGTSDKVKLEKALAQLQRAYLKRGMGVR